MKTFGASSAPLLLALLLLPLAPGCSSPGPAGEAPPPVVSTEWLAARLEEADLVVLDSRPSLLDYLAGHLPGAQHLCVENLSTSSAGVPAQILPPEVLEIVLGRAGIDNSSTVVVYGESSDNHAAFVANLLRTAGLERVSVLDGGLTRWSGEGRPVTTERLPVENRDPELALDPDSLASFERVQGALGDDGTVILDARDAPGYEAGHIPGALSRPWNQDVVPEGQENAGTFRDLETLAREYEALGVTRDKEVIVYCGAGLEAAEVAYTLRHRLGFENVRLYDGSWAEWSLTEGAPNETGSGAPPEAIESARAAADALTRELKSHLVTELQRGGPAGAVRVCAEMAQAVAASRSTENTDVRRVSLKYRNLADRPDPFEEEVLRHMEQLRQEGQLPTEVSQVVAQADGRVLRYMRPIMVASPCLTCHGDPESIDPEVRELLQEHYPNDLATGYHAGDLRGAVSVTVRLD